ncbi:MAG: DNA topoisomerase, partial [Candidatus Hodarchaeales archaeon]
ASHKHDLSNIPFTFKLKRGRIYDELAAKKLYQSIEDARAGEIKSLETVEEIIPRPFPLDTDTLESEGSWLFNRSPKKIADIAEKLYNNGFITYPRTESSYYLQKDLTPQVEKFKDHAIYGTVVTEILKEETAKNPSKGKFTKEHEPIRPVKPATEKELEKSLKLSENDLKLAWKIYDYVVRRFLATVDKEGKATVKNIILDIKGEEFEGKSIDIKTQCKALKTQPPYLWTESHLIREMARLGIGTDATRSSHIATVIYRRYVRKAPGSRGLIPTQIGLTLFELLTENASRLIHPDIRKTVEEWTQKIQTDEMTPDEVDSKVIELTENGIKNLKEKEEEIFTNLSQSIREFTGDGTPLEICPECGSNMVLRSSARAKRYLACENENCDMMYFLPRKGKLTAVKGTCIICKIMKPIRVGQGMKAWFFCPKCWIERTSGENKEPFFCSICKEECNYAGDKSMSRLIELLPDGKDNFPVGKGIEVISGKILVNILNWKKAVVLVKFGNKKQLRFYGWQKNKEGKYKLRQKFNISEEYSAVLASVLEAFFESEESNSKNKDSKEKNSRSQ